MAGRDWLWHIYGCTGQGSDNGQISNKETRERGGTPRQVEEARPSREGSVGSLKRKDSPNSALQPRRLLSEMGR